MDTFTRQDFEGLAKHSDLWCVSIYLPTDRTSNGMLQTPIRLRNLATQAENLLAEHGLRTPEARRLMEPLRGLPDRKGFLNAVSEGLAIFVDAGGMRTYRLPQRFQERVVVGRRFHIKPLLPLVVCDGRFLLLSVSANRVRLFAGNRWVLKELEVPGLPENMAQSLHYDEPQKIRQVHTADVGAGHRIQLSFHGQGGGVDVAKDEVLEFFRSIDRSLRKLLADEQAPLVFAGVEYFFHIFKTACSYQHVAEESIVGNTDDWNHEQLHAAAWSVVEPLFKSQRENAVARSHRVAGTDYGLLQLEMVLQACRLGQVDTLLVDAQESRWGTFDPEWGIVHLDAEHRPGNEDLLDLAVAQTVRNSGKVFPADACELPDRSVVAAVLRYPGTATPIPRRARSVEMNAG